MLIPASSRIIPMPIKTMPDFLKNVRDLFGFAFGASLFSRALIRLERIMRVIRAAAMIITTMTMISCGPSLIMYSPDCFVIVLTKILYKNSMFEALVSKQRAEL